MEQSPLKGRFRLVCLLGDGAFGEVYQAIDTESGESCAVKVERKDALHPQLKTEWDVLRTLQGKGIPRALGMGQTESLYFLAEELLGEDLSSASKHRLSVKRVSDIVQQCIERVEFVHRCSYLHNDVKPHNFCLGRDEHTVYLIDFGLAKRFEDGKNKAHVAYRENVAFVGTASYASLNVLMGVHPSRRDDLESVLLVAIRLLAGRLPWEHIHEKSKSRKYSFIRQLKLIIPIEKLCSSLPPQILTAYNYVRQLKFTQRPDYEYVRSLFAEIGGKKDLKGLQNSEADCDSPLLRRMVRTSSTKVEPSTHIARATVRRPSGPPAFHQGTAGRRKKATPRERRMSALPHKPASKDDLPPGDDSFTSEKTVRLDTLPSLSRAVLARYSGGGGSC